MQRHRSYHGRKTTARRRRTYSAEDQQSSATRSAVRLYICIGLFIAAVLLKFIFPATFAGVGEKINTVVNYKAALATLGEGISGEKKFTSALGEAFTYAFTGQDINDTAADGEDEDGDTDDAVSETEEDSGYSFADAVIAAFMQDQSAYSDYSIPAGVTYAMPRIMIDFTTPLSGVVSSPFGYGIHPTEDCVRFHYGIDIEAESGTKIAAFADGKVIDVGETDTLGKYVMLSHGNVETVYAHCSQIFAVDGQAIRMGQELASVGMTGDAASPHLHFELKVNGLYVNPAYYL